MFPEPDCTHGYSFTLLRATLGADRFADLMNWMHGQTMTLCQMDPQREWVDDPDAPGGMRLEDVGPPLCDQAHGSVVYVWDVLNFLRGGPIWD